MLNGHLLRQPVQPLLEIPTKTSALSPITVVLNWNPVAKK
jgi:hypothetical protein